MRLPLTWSHPPGTSSALSAAWLKRALEPNKAATSIRRTRRVIFIADGYLSHELDPLIQLNQAAISLATFSCGRSGWLIKRVPGAAEDIFHLVPDQFFHFGTCRGEGIPRIEFL